MMEASYGEEYIIKSSM